MRNRNTPWESASLVLAVPFVAVALFLCGCGDEGSAEATAAKSKGQEPIVQLHQGEAQGTTYSIKYLSEERLDDAVEASLVPPQVSPLPYASVRMSSALLVQCLGPQSFLSSLELCSALLVSSQPLES